MNDQELLRTAAHRLPELDIAGQRSYLLPKHWSLARAGVAYCSHLASAGIGEITLVDDDDVDLLIARQIIHNEARIGTNKAESAALTRAPTTTAR